MRAAWLLLLAAAAARADRLPDATPEQAAERDRLIEQIARGEAWDASVRKFRALIEPLYAQKEAAEADKKHKRDLADYRRQWLDAYRKTPDYAAASRCSFAVDPAATPPGHYLADWGKVTRREEVRLPPRNALDPGEERVLYEVAGRAGPYLIDGTRFSWDHGQRLEAKVGDLVLVCPSNSRAHDERLPPDWQRSIHDGLGARIRRPPKIAEKGRFAPVWVSSGSIESAARSVRWEHPPGTHLLVHAEIGEAVGDGRYAMGGGSGSWVLEVPPALRKRPALVTGQYAWLIVGRQRWDVEAKKLVLELDDIDERYVIEP
jgi:hypothetical protein